LLLPPGIVVGSSMTISCPCGMESVVSRPSPESSDVLLYLHTGHIDGVRRRRRRRRRSRPASTDAPLS
jgi:hypothetical protein